MGGGRERKGKDRGSWEKENKKRKVGGFLRKEGKAVTNTEEMVTGGKGSARIVSKKACRKIRGSKIQEGKRKEGKELLYRMEGKITGK